MIDPSAGLYLLRYGNGYTDVGPIACIALSTACDYRSHDTCDIRSRNGRNECVSTLRERFKRTLDRPSRTPSRNCYSMHNQWGEDAKVFPSHGSLQWDRDMLLAISASDMHEPRALELVQVIVPRVRTLRDGGRRLGTTD